ncbi:Y-family DNA polymerase [Spirosoma aureum]|uniref:Y-family DNA polymerase n=1 Tax=Spirosoma aureum TaxID=2692134 RepID=A0A6G9AMY4_9BACT|nr:Y-family DNA polymerase [Spirosoma aureum]QIP13778.1 Y-family DNA polymerase [Spirosoma aureum]
MYGLIDVNAMYVSCERAFNPRLNGVPVVAVGNNDHCVIARSNEAKILGIKMGQPLFQIRELIDEHNVQICSSNFELIGDMSARMMSVLAQFADDVEPYSIDEAFIQVNTHFDGIYPSYQGLGYAIRDTIGQWLRLPVCVGFGITKTLAKVANKRAKAKPELGGVCVITNGESAEEALREFPVKDLWGIGSQYARLLKKNGIETAWQLQRIEDLDWVRDRMTVNGLRMVYELRGFPCRLLEVNAPPKKTICTAVSFGKLIPDLKNITDALTTYLARCCEKLRKQESLARHVTVFLHTNPNRITPGNGLPAKQYSASRSVRLPHYTNHLPDFLRYAIPVVESLFQFGYNYQKVGVILNDIIPDTIHQGNLFAEFPTAKSLHIGKTIDRINRKHGRDKVRLASQLQSPDWSMVRGSLSRQYTTDWNQLLKAK